MKNMKGIPLPTQGSKQHLTMLFLEENKEKNIFFDFDVFLCEFNMHLIYCV